MNVIASAWSRFLLAICCLQVHVDGQGESTGSNGANLHRVFPHYLMWYDDNGGGWEYENSQVRMISQLHLCAHSFAQGLKPRALWTACRKLCILTGHILRARAKK